jgi:hypothetical protein
VRTSRTEWWGVDEWRWNEFVVVGDIFLNVMLSDLTDGHWSEVLAEHMRTLIE